MYAIGVNSCINNNSNFLDSKYFYKKLQNFSPIKGDSRKLFLEVPQNITVEEIVDFIFAKCSPWRIPSLLEGIAYAYPSFRLSPYDEVRLAIIKDQDLTLNNTWLQTKLAECGSLDKIGECAELAYKCEHPCLYEETKEPIAPDKYSINFLWVNLNPQDRVANIASHIFGEGRDSIEENHFFNAVKSWVYLHPGVEINLWYDSALVTKKALENTLVIMNQISEDSGAFFALRDIRQLNISRELELSLHPSAPVYYRVDLLKALIAHDCMIKAPDKYIVVVDGDVEPISPSGLFDKRTVMYLEDAGYVLNGKGIGFPAFENNFFIFNGKNREVQEEHYHKIINSIEEASVALKGYAIGVVQARLMLHSQSVYNKYLDFFTAMGEQREGPRKFVRSPRSQFAFGGSFSLLDHRAEAFRFVGEGEIPFVRHGRGSGYGEIEEPVAALADWRMEPLSRSSI